MRQLEKPRLKLPGVRGSTEEVQIYGADDSMLKNRQGGAASVRKRE
jgi:hypothetical protein